MLSPNEVLHMVEYLIKVCGGAVTALAEQPSAVQYVVYATVAIRLAVALIQLTWWLVRIVRGLLCWQRRRANPQRQIVAAVPPRSAYTPMGQTPPVTEAGKRNDQTEAL